MHAMVVHMMVHMVVDHMMRVMVIVMVAVRQMGVMPRPRRHDVWLGRFRDRRWR
jgi:hypothetical protein